MSELREALEGAFDSSSEGDSGGSPAPGEQAAPTPIESNEVSAPSASPVSETAPDTSTSDSRQRDPKGRFASKSTTPKAASTPEGLRGTAPAGDSPPPITNGAVPQPVEAKPSPTPELRAPQSWKPMAREKWAAVPADVQQEINRREREITVELQNAATERKLASAFQQTVSPFMGMIQAEGGDPLKAVGSLLQTAAALRTAPPAHKAQLVANMVRSFGVPIEALDSALAGQAIPDSQSQGAYKDPRVDDLLARLQQAEQQRTHSTMQRAHQEVEQFAAKAEFLEDVREDMADVMELATKRGRAMSIEEAYNRALKMHPELSEVLQQREEAKKAENAQASTQRARAAASSVKSQPANGVQSTAPDSLRDQLLASITALSGR